MTTNKKTVSPYAQGPGALEARQKAMRPSFKDLEKRAEALAAAKAAEFDPDEIDPEDLPEGVNMGGGGRSPHAPEDTRQKLLQAEAEKRAAVVNGGPPKENFDPLNPFPDNSRVVHPEEVNMVRTETPNHNSMQPVITATPCEHEAFFDQEQAVTLRMDNGQFTINAIDVRENEFSIAVMVSLEDRFIFIPVPGAEMTLTYKLGRETRTRKVFFPGTHVNYEELSVMVLVFVLADKPETDDGN